MSSSTFNMDKERVYYEKDGRVIIDKRIEDLTPIEQDIVRKHCITIYRILFFGGLLLIVVSLIILFLVPEDIASASGPKQDSLESLSYIFLIIGPLLFVGGIAYKLTMPHEWVFEGT